MGTTEVIFYVTLIDFLWFKNSGIQRLSPEK